MTRKTDSSSISTTDPIKKSPAEIDSSNDENSQPSPRRTCCLICSILPNLSNINTCQKHLSSLIAPVAPTQVVYMMHPPVDNCPKSHCHCRSKSKRRRRSSSSSSSSSSAELRRYRKKRSMTVLSSDTSSQDDIFFSPNAPSQGLVPSQQQSRHSQARLSPSLPPSTSINTNVNNSLRKYQQLVMTSFLHRANERNNEDIESMSTDTQNRPASEANSSDVIEITSNSTCSSPVPNHRIVHVKDDDEVGNEMDQKTGLINMAQVTEEMRNHECPQPMILLKRVRLDQFPPLDEQT